MEVLSGFASRGQSDPVGYVAVGQRDRIRLNNGFCAARRRFLNIFRFPQDGKQALESLHVLGIPGKVNFVQHTVASVIRASAVIEATPADHEHHPW